ncbi:MAG: (Fe-S)-binding protein [Methanobrevibacter boviskoreani]|jgi:Fe-S oxidoreductase|uniref:(Fe-S)-binding protein n=1 Tax=Methanobrevibacter boviskoreani TaxID=1348249 RepID=UPI000593A610|nr:(Fe-S)-binding protein [Methanobrevibacter boviskoreani]MCI6931040.1 (Fe-S)-binding protein [Methanobrevibacter boviskoreani]MDD6256686.1 (Fe-S)-binding protein [Methanobrevibacter boviskoreani]
MLYFRGCTAREKDSNIENATKYILDKAGIDYHTIDNEECCGSILLRSGFYDGATEQMKRTYNDIKDEDLILTSCAGCYKTLNDDYKEILGYDLNVIHISQLLYKLIDEGKIEVNDNFKDLKVTYHDPCHLGRASKVYDEPREVIGKYSNLVEMENNRENALCCGSGGGVKSAFPEISANISKNRIKQAEDTKCDLIVTACPFCKLNLGSNSENLKVIDLSEFVAKALKKEDI